jgi:hypothetical protein
LGGLPPKTSTGKGVTLNMSINNLTNRANYTGFTRRDDLALLPAGDLGRQSASD